LSDGDLLYAIGARTLGVEDDPDLVVDEIIRLIGEERIHALLCDPCRLRVGQRNFFGRLASAAAARTAVVSATVLFLDAGGIQGREIFSNGTGCLLGLRPGNRLVAGRPLSCPHPP